MKQQFEKDIAVLAKVFPIQLASGSRAMENKWPLGVEEKVKHKKVRRRSVGRPEYLALGKLAILGAWIGETGFSASAIRYIYNLTDRSLAKRVFEQAKKNADPDHVVQLTSALQELWGSPITLPKKS